MVGLVFGMPRPRPRTWTGLRREPLHGVLELPEERREAGAPLVGLALGFEARDVLAVLAAGREVTCVVMPLDDRPFCAGMPATASRAPFLVALCMHFVLNAKCGA